MSIGDREGLIARIRQLRRTAGDPGGTAGATGESLSDRVRALEGRMAHLEQLLEGLQDSVYRESERHAKLIAEIQAQVEPAAMRASLAQDARDRGL
jgi:uncharacterized coiled-coil protein SlyX